MKKYKKFKVNVFPDFFIQTAKMLATRRDMDYVLGFRPSFSQSGLKEEDFITFPGIPDTSIDFDTTKESTWKNYMMIVALTCSIHPIIIKNWKEIRSVATALRTDWGFLKTSTNYEKSVESFEKWLKVHKLGMEKSFSNDFSEFGLKAIMKKVDEGFFCHEKTKSNSLVCKANKDKK